MNAARHAHDARAEARSLRQLLERAVNLALAGQQLATSDLQGALALARITEFHAARTLTAIEREHERADITTPKEAAPCL